MNRYLLILTWGTGAGALGIELTAARLVEPWFGNSQLVWAALISLVLASLALGAWQGGRIGDRHVRLDYLLLTVMGAGWFTTLIPLLVPPILRHAIQDLLAFQTAQLLSAIALVAVLVSIPVILLGAISPWAVRIALFSVEAGGRITGRLYAAATVGSIAGTLLPVLWLIPSVGTRWTFHLMATFLMVLATSGTMFLDRVPRTRILMAGVAGCGAVLLSGFLSDSSALRQLGSRTPAGALVYEDESRFNYIAVRQQGSETYLKLNEGVGIHSVDHPDNVLSQGVWDYFLLAPWFSASPPEPSQAKVLVIGLAAGTVSSLWTDIYGPAPITGVELDPQIIAVGRRYFGMNQSNLTAVAADGRRWLQSQPVTRTWDVVAIDAYRVPYIPFHLTTVEFFQLTFSRLTESGVVAINVGRTQQDQTLVDSLVATMATVFPTVVVLNEPVPAGTLGNALVVGLRQPTDLAWYQTHILGLSPDYPAAFRSFARASLNQVAYATADPELPPLTDDKAPVERIVHGIVWNFLRSAGVGF